MIFKVLVYYSLLCYIVSHLGFANNLILFLDFTLLSIITLNKSLQISLNVFRLVI